ncbi:hypothetical protein PVBG_02447 [Plasmodium vivax Brazil I]|uniref:Variable surface protein Vir9-like protein n=1 Tax=Plasmodium vivax (strain Brazil I) TaxID=1033975 RepID=A0A0J9T077_PLAV1|nr:hypothetical protein PVBG_02447 [Plasmodium vivax Brazil I]
MCTHNTIQNILILVITVNYYKKKFLSLFTQYNHIFEKCAIGANTETYTHCSNYTELFKDIDHNSCSDLENACPIVSKYIKQLEEYSEKNIEVYIYLYYYMYGKFVKNKDNCNILEIYKKLLKVYCESDEGKKCNDLLSHINNYDFVKMKKLMDQHSSFFDRTYKDDSNCEYAKECAELYEQYIKDCYGFVNSYYCNELKNFKYDYENKMKEAKCPNVPKILTSAEVIDLQYFVVTPVSTMLVICLISFILCKVNNHY